VVKKLRDGESSLNLHRNMVAVEVVDDLLNSCREMVLVILKLENTESGIDPACS